VREGNKRKREREREGVFEFKNQFGAKTEKDWWKEWIRFKKKR